MQTVANYKKAVLSDGTEVIVDLNNRQRNGKGKWIYFATAEVDCVDPGKARGFYYPATQLFAADLSGKRLIG